MNKKTLIIGGTGIMSIGVFLFRKILSKLVWIIIETFVLRALKRFISTKLLKK